MSEAKLLKVKNKSPKKSKAQKENNNKESEKFIQLSIH